MVVVQWDPMPDVEGKEGVSSDETQQVLPPHKWNKDVEGAWILDMMQLWRIITLRNVRAIVMLDVIPMPTAATQSWRGGI